ncbi:MAG: hypothetical protein MJD61_12230 [Proteobacteria bacterium]|nr:hypothetical protein [Pseudomonadota bacterium]
MHRRPVRVPEPIVANPGAGSGTRTDAPAALHLHGAANVVPPWSDATSTIVLSPMDLIAPLCALVPPPYPGAPNP